MIEQEWGLAKIWNESLSANRKERLAQPRDHLWASELGKAKIDIWLKLKGEKPTNPPNNRSLRKFEAGNIWEWIVGLVLIRAGILQKEQEWLPYQYPGLLKVTGKLDFLAGGKPNYDRAKKTIDGDFPDFIKNAGQNIVSYFKEKYPEGIKPMVLEVKSTSSFMFDNYEKKGTSSLNHRLQLIHYLKAKKMEKGMLIYICKDDCRMLEVPILVPSIDEERYKKEIEEITQYYNNNEQPPLEKPIVYDRDIEKFAKNWQIAYSGYLTKLYGFKDQKEFDDKYTPLVSKWNRVLGRVKDGKKMTDKNKKVLEEIKQRGFILNK